jgi:hypothetical protein
MERKRCASINGLQVVNANNATDNALRSREKPRLLPSGPWEKCRDRKNSEFASKYI